MASGVFVTQNIDPICPGEPTVGSTKITLKTNSTGLHCQLYDAGLGSWIVPGEIGTFDFDVNGVWTSCKLPCLDELSGPGGESAIDLGYYYEFVVTTQNPETNVNEDCTYQGFIDCGTAGLIDGATIDLIEIIPNTPVSPLPGSALCNTFAACETTTSLVDNNNGTISYFDEDGVETIVSVGGGGGGGPETVTTLTAGSNGTYIYSSEDNTQTTIDPVQSIRDFSDNALTYNGSNGQLSLLKHDGTVDVVNLPIENFLSTASFDNGTGVLTLGLSNGGTFNVDLTDLIDVETVTTLVDNGGSFTFTNEAGADTTIALGGGGAETVTTLVAGANGTYDYTNEDNTVTTIDPVASIINNSDNSLVYSNGQLSLVKHDGTFSTVNIPVENFLSNASFNDATNILTLTLSDGSNVTVNLSDLVDNQTITTMVDNGNGTLTYTNENNTQTTFRTADREKIVFGSSALVTETGTSGIEIFDRPITIYSVAVTAATAPSAGNEIYQIRDISNGNALIASVTLNSGSQSTGIVNVANYTLPTGNLLQAEITQVNGSEKATLHVFYEDASELEI